MKRHTHCASAHTYLDVFRAYCWNLYCSFARSSTQSQRYLRGVCGSVGQRVGGWVGGHRVKLWPRAFVLCMSAYTHIQSVDTSIRACVCVFIGRHGLDTMGSETNSRFFSRYGFVDRSSLSKSQFKVRELSRSYLTGSGGEVCVSGWWVWF